MDKGKYYWFVYNQLKYMKHLPYNYEKLTEIFFELMTEHYDFEDVDVDELRRSLEWSMADLGMDENLVGE